MYIRYDSFDGWWRIEAPLKMRQARAEAQKAVYGQLNKPGSCQFIGEWAETTPSWFQGSGRHAYERQFWQNGRKHILNVAWREDTKETAFKTTEA